MFADVRREVMKLAGAGRPLLNASPSINGAISIYSARFCVIHTGFICACSLSPHRLTD